MVGSTSKNIQLREELLGLQKAVAAANPGEISRIVVAEIEVVTRYYNTMLGQAALNLRWALATAAISLGCLGAASFFRLIRQTDVVSIVKSGGLVAALVSGVLFFVYARLSVQLAAFLQSLDGLHRFLLAGNLCSALSGEAREKAWAELASSIAAAAPQRASAMEAILSRLEGGKARS